MTWVYTKVWLCGIATWRWITFSQWNAMPNIGKKLALIKAEKISATLLCASGAGVVLPHVIPSGTPSTPPPVVIVSASPGEQVVHQVPEPGGVLVLAVGVVGLASVKAARAAMTRFAVSVP